MVESQCENLWDNNSGADLEHHPKSEYGTALDVPTNQLIISHQFLRSNILSLWIKTH